ncbi:MLO-like protein 13 [Cucumis sativus]|uniref:MLO-like protein n=1 Tax=Cucumis sativus TaxID=3659 RepID=A0A0A0LQD7_CUCSA|nr:MLO-like protein 13 [Cucumis sativus]KGN62216.1 hypothetical protein Csa_016954 [Cucumis sativus]
MDGRGNSNNNVHDHPPNAKFEFTPTWIIAVVSSIIVIISFSLERGLHHLGQKLQKKQMDELNHALLKLKEELMILGFISLLFNVFQGAIGRFCMPKDFAYHMLPCKRSTVPVVNHFSSSNFVDHNYNIHRHLLSTTQANFQHCSRKGKVPLLSLEALHQLHIFIFVLAVVHVIFCATTMLLASAKIRLWKRWEESIDKRQPTQSEDDDEFNKRAVGFWRRAAVIAWMMAFRKQFYGSITKSDYKYLRRGFIKKHCPGELNFDFYDHIKKTYQHDFKKVVGISWYLWAFVVLFLLLNLEGWHTYFWLSFLPLIMLLLVGAKLEYIITRMAQELNLKIEDKEAQQQQRQQQERDERHFDRQQHRRNINRHGSHHHVDPSDEYFWFHSPSCVLHLIHFILFQNSFEIAFFFWIWTTYGFKSCIMEKPAYIITRLILGGIVQVLCSYSTLPLYSLVTQMGSEYKKPSDHEEHGKAEERIS